MHDTNNFLSSHSISLYILLRHVTFISHLLHFDTILKQAFLIRSRKKQEWQFTEMTSTPDHIGTSADLLPEVKEFFLTDFTRTVAEITAKAHLVPQIEIIANDAELLRGLIERMQRGSKADVRSFVDEIFESFPFGLRTSIVYSLTEIFKEWQQHQKARKRRRKSDVAELFSHEVCGDLVKKWKSGAFSPSELYEGISSAVVNGSMEPQLAKRMVDLTLQDAGYIRTYNDRADFDKTERFRADAKGFDLVNLQSVAANLDGSEIEMMTYGGISATVSSTKKTVTNKSYPSSYNMTTKGKQLWWRHEGGGDQLFFLQPENSSSLPLLLIGGSLKLDNGDLDIEVVIGVDVCPHTSSDETLSATILVDGQWLGELDRSTRGMCDGASEVGGDDDNDNNSTGSGDEEESPRVGRSLGATQTVKRRYYCVFISVINGTVIVRYVTPIHKSLVLDQHPSMILSLRPALAVVGGTNGLLGLVDASVFSLYSSQTPSADQTSHTVASYQIYQGQNQRNSSFLDSYDSPLMRNDDGVDFNPSTSTPSSSSSSSARNLSSISNLSDLAGRVRIGSVITLKNSAGPSSYTTLSSLGELRGGESGVSGGGRDRDRDRDLDRVSESNDSMKEDYRTESFFPLTVDSFARDILMNSAPKKQTQIPNSELNTKCKQDKRTSLTRMRESFSSSRTSVTLPMSAISGFSSSSSSSPSGGPSDRQRGTCMGRETPNALHHMNKVVTLPNGGEVIVTHAADACITALSYSGEESCVFASGDSMGVICLWRVVDDCIDSFDQFDQLQNEGGKRENSRRKESHGQNEREGAMRGSECSLVRLAAMPLCMSGTDGLTSSTSDKDEKDKLNSGCRVNSLFVSPSGRHVAIGLWDRLLLAALGESDEERGDGWEEREGDGDATTQEDEMMNVDSKLSGCQYSTRGTSPLSLPSSLPLLPSMYIRSSLDIVTGCRAVYSVVFRIPQLHIWRITNTPLAHAFSPIKSKRMPTTKSSGIGSRIPPSKEPRPPPRVRNSTTRDREFRFFPDILRRSSTPSTSTSRTSSIFSLSSPSSPTPRGRRFSISSAPSTPLPLAHEPQSPWISTAVPNERSSAEDSSFPYTGSNNGVATDLSFNGGYMSDDLTHSTQNTHNTNGMYNTSTNISYLSSDSDMKGNDHNGRGGRGRGGEGEGPGVPSAEDSLLGVTVTSWLHPNMDCFGTRFGMAWNDQTFYNGCFSEADDDAGE